MRNIQKQHGATFIGLLFNLGLLGFGVLLVLKIGPIYLNHSRVTQTLAALKEAGDLPGKSEHEIRQMLRKRFDLSYVTDVTAQDATIISRGNYVKVHIQYQAVANIIGNLSALAEFDDMIEIGQP